MQGAHSSERVQKAKGGKSKETEENTAQGEGNDVCAKTFPR